MLGFALFNYLNSKEKITVIGTIKKANFYNNSCKNIFTNVDVQNFNMLKKKITKISPDIIINCIGIVKSEVKNNNSKNVIKINSKLPNFLNDISNNFCILVVFFFD